MGEKDLGQDLTPVAHHNRKVVLWILKAKQISQDLYSLFLTKFSVIHESDFLVIRFIGSVPWSLF